MNPKRETNLMDQSNYICSFSQDLPAGWIIKWTSAFS